MWYAPGSTMQVKIEDVSPVEKKLIVEIPWETVSNRLGDAYRELGKGVQLKGFRKGHVPRSVLEQMYGPRVHAEVAYQLVRESFFTATAEHKIAGRAQEVSRDLAVLGVGDVDERRHAVAGKLAAREVVNNPQSAVLQYAALSGARSEGGGGQ